MFDTVSLPASELLLGKLISYFRAYQNYLKKGLLCNVTPRHINETFSPVSNQCFSIYYHNKMNYIEYSEPLAYFDMICKI
jgi:hypothetical protein